MAETEVIIFKLAGRYYGMGIQYVQGIEPYQSVLSVANAPDCVEGIVNIREEAVPVYSLQTKFHLPHMDVTDNTKFMLIRSRNDNTVAFVVDEVLGMKRVPEEEMKSVPRILETEHTEYLAGIARLDGELILIIRPEALLNHAESKEVEEFLSEK